LKLAFRAAENDVMKGAAELLNRPSACKIKIALNRQKFHIYFCIRAFAKPWTK
jgi:hypothetical protein